MESKIVVFSKPGAGKETRISRFEAVRGNLYGTLSVGNLLRAERKQQTELGKKAESYMKKGKLVPDEIINKVVINGLKETHDPILMDGFPRTVVQAEEMLKAGVIPNFVIVLEVSDDVVIQRAKDRIVCEDCGASYTLNDFNPPKQAGVCDKCSGKLIRRDDDEEETVKERLETFYHDTYPVLNVFKNYGIKIYTIDNTNSDEAEKQFDQLLMEALEE